MNNCKETPGEINELSRDESHGGTAVHPAMDDSCEGWMPTQSAVCIHRAPGAHLTGPLPSTAVRRAGGSWSHTAQKHQITFRRGPVPSLGLIAIPALPKMCCVSLSRALDLSESQLPHCVTTSKSFSFLSQVHPVENGSGCQGSPCDGDWMRP